MLVALSVTSDMARAMARLDKAGRGQIPFAASQAVNRLARQAVADLKIEMAKVFSQPTPFTLNAFYWTKATRHEPTAEIRAKDFAGKGTPGWKYLTPEVFGGTRRMKRFERALEAKVGSTFSVPGSGAPLNQYGNISQGDINKILSALGAFGENGYNANRKGLTARQRLARKKAGFADHYTHPQFFVAHAKSNGGLLGIYRIVSRGHVEPVLIFPKSAPSYRKRLPYRETIEASFKKNERTFFDEALADALATAR